MGSGWGIGCLDLSKGQGANLMAEHSRKKIGNLFRDGSLGLARSGRSAAVHFKREIARGSLISGVEGNEERKPRILIAGGGIGGLVLALAAKNKGFDVKVFEKDLSAVRGEGQYRGPIQIQSNALAALEAVDAGVAEEIMESSCVTGDRINGFVDGLSGEWYIKFDTFTPAVERGLPITRVISRMTLQHILACAVGPEIIENRSNVVDFEDDGRKVTVILEDGRRYNGDLLVGADGIWSTVRTKLFGLQKPKYSEYTCYTGIADFVPSDIKTVGYRIFLGHKQYFVSCDVGGGRMQWYAFHNEPARGVDPPNGKKERLLKLFGNWCEEVVGLLLATPQELILRRDIYDIEPISTWSKGLVTLLGDSAHAMQPNMGQGGCMAIEDSYQLALELEKACKQTTEGGKSVDIASTLKRYENERKLRTGVIHWMARTAATMISYYKSYLDVESLLFLKKLQIRHPGTIGAKYFLQIVMPLMLSWVLGGNSSKLEGWIPSCRLSDKAYWLLSSSKSYLQANDQVEKWLADDEALESTFDAEWYLVPVEHRLPTFIGWTAQAIHLSKEENRPSIVGSIACANSEGVAAVISFPQVSEKHACIACKGNAFFLTDLCSQHGTWITDYRDRRHRAPPNLPVRIHPNFVIEFGPHKKAAFRVKLHKAFCEGNSIRQDKRMLDAP